MKRFNLVVGTAAAGLFVGSFNLAAQMHHHSAHSQAQEKTMKADTSMAGGQSEMTARMGKPSFEQSVDGLRFKVWLITQKEHEKMMNAMMKDSAKSGMMGHDMKEGGMKHDMGGMMHGDMKMGHDMKGMEMKHGEMGDKGMMENMMAGTHHIMVVVTDERTGKAVKDASLQAETLSPSKKAQTTKLSTMMNHFGGGLKLDENGQYSIALEVKVDDRPSKLQFIYTVE